MVQQAEHPHEPGRSTDADVAETAFLHDRDTGEHDALVVRAVTIGKPRQELYDFWRDFRNLAAFMENVERVDVLDGRRSHWVVKAPGGRTVEWDSLITEDEPGRRIAWRSADGADVDNSGHVEFRDAPTDHGTEVRVRISYDPPGGKLGQALAKAFQKEPNVQARRDLRRLKALMETGEIPTARAPDAAPRGNFIGTSKDED
jgi:uncharacterized membrane protein